MSDKPSVPNDEHALRAEIDRLNRIVIALMNRAEKDMDAPRSDFSVFEETITLKDKVRTRTQELEAALLENEKITRALKQSKKQIEQNERRLHDITSALGEGLLVLNADASITFVNTAACNVLGYKEAEMLGRNAHELFHHSYLDHSHYPIQACLNMKVIQTGKPYLSEEEYFWRKNGTYFPASVITTPIILNENDKGIVMAFHDITQSVEERNRLREMQAAIEQSPASVLIVDKNKNIIYTNPQVTRSTGYTKIELQNQKTTLFHGDMTPNDAYMDLWKTLLSGAPWKGEILYKRKDGSVFWQFWNVAPVLDNNGVIQHFVGVGEDITEKKKLQNLLQEMSYSDGLTGIANRRRFDDYFKQEWQRASRNGKPVAIIMADIDFFKRYNDNLGHQAGDECLKCVAQALKSKILRSSDLLARYGGEEFVCVLPETDMKGAKLVAETLRQAVCAIELPHPNSTVSHFVTISIGVACCVPIQGKPSELLGAADAALYRAKTLGGNRVEIE